MKYSWFDSMQSNQINHCGVSVDIGHFFYTSLTQCLVFLGILLCQESKIWTFFEGLRSSWTPQKQERKNNHNSTIFWAKNKIRMNFLWDKLNIRIFVVQWSFEKLDFFSLVNQKNWLYNTNNEQISNSKSLFVANL